MIGSSTSSLPSQISNGSGLTAISETAATPTPTIAWYWLRMASFSRDPPSRSASRLDNGSSVIGN